MASAASAQAQKVYWIGRHAAVPELGSPISKVHKEGLQLLRSLGWAQVQNDTACVPVFAFTTRKGANYPADMPGLPVVRQLPHVHTSCLDDKRSMAQHVTAAGMQHLMPPCWDSIEAFVAAQEQQHNWGLGLEQMQHPQHMKVAEHVEQKRPEQQQQQQLGGEDAAQQQLQQLQLHDQGLPPSCPAGAGCSGTVIATSGRDGMKGQYAATASSSSCGDALLLGRSATAAVDGSNSMRAQDPTTTTTSSSSSNGALLPGGSVFVKHRRGVKGQAVYVARTMQQLLQLQQCLKGSSRDFVVQQEVPPLLLQGRKFVMRVHVLVVLQLLQQHCEDPASAAAAPVRVFVHEDVIVLPHAKQYNPASDDSAVHISSKGKQHPPPVLLAGSQLPTDLQESVWQQLQSLAVRCIGAVSHVLLPTSVHPGAVLYHLFGFDCMVNTAGRVVLLEVNSYPAIASGTMCGVDVGVYTRLVGDLVRLLVLPVADAVAPEAGGFVEAMDVTQ